MTKPITFVTFNTQSGSQLGLLHYVATKIAETKPDVVAFQEVHHAHSSTVPTEYMPIQPGARLYPIRLHLYQELCAILGDEYVGHYAPHLFGLHDLEVCPYDVSYGLALFVRKKTCQLDWYHSGFIFEELNQFNQEATGGPPCGKVAQIALIKIKNSGAQVIVANVHGFWSMHGKVDCRYRFRQNIGIQKLLNVFVKQAKPNWNVLLMGDLNYRSDMRALGHLKRRPVFGKDGVILNHEHCITKTRTLLYKKWVAEPEADFMISCQRLANICLGMTPDFHAKSDHVWLEAQFAL